MAERRWQLGHPGGEGGPARLGVLRHEIEDVAQVLQRGGDDVERHLVQTRGVDLLVQLQPVAQGGDRDAVDVVHRLDAGQRGEGALPQLGEGGAAGRGDVVEVLVGPDPGVRHDRAQAPRHGVEVVVGDAVSLARGTRRCSWRWGRKSRPRTYTSDWTVLDQPGLRTA